MSWQLTSFGVVKYIVGTTYLACQLLFYLSIQSVFSFAPRTTLTDNLTENSVIFWDAHYGPNEGGVPIEQLYESPKVQLLKEFYPQDSAIGLGGEPYSVVIFKESY